MTILDERSAQVIDTEPSPPTTPRRRARVWLAAVSAVGVAVVGLAFLIGGGSRSGDTSLIPTKGGSARNAAPSMATPLPAPEQASGSSTSALPAAPVDAVSKVVKTGDIDLGVDKGQVPHTLDQLIGFATLAGGFVAESHSSAGASPSGSVTLRVPVQSFEATVARVRQLPKVDVVSQQTAGQDVTSKYVDLQARVHSLVATRSTYERLLAQAKSIGDTLAVQSRISDIQTQIEQLQGELRVLDDQTTYGTLTVTVAEKGTKAAPVHHQSGMSKAFHRSLDRFVGGIEAIVGIVGPVLLVALIGALAFVVGRLVYRRVRRQPA